MGFACRRNGIDISYPALRGCQQGCSAAEDVRETLAVSSRVSLCFWGDWSDCHTCNGVSVTRDTMRGVVIDKCILCEKHSATLRVGVVNNECSELPPPERKNGRCFERDPDGVRKSTRTLALAPIGPVGVPGVRLLCLLPVLCRLLLFLLLPRLLQSSSTFFLSQPHLLIPSVSLAQSPISFPRLSPSHTRSTTYSIYTAP
jgi:hypothetical protein